MLDNELTACLKRQKAGLLKYRFDHPSCSEDMGGRILGRDDALAQSGRRHYLGNGHVDRSGRLA
jgi:hypothetical protein